MDDPRVGVARLESLVYGDAVAAGDGVERAIGRLCRMLGWANADSTFGDLVRPGARVLVKPNWVSHRNEGGEGTDPLVTHPTVIRAVVESLLETGASEVALGDAPLQLCDFDALVAIGGLDRWCRDLAEREARFRGPLDFRRTRSLFEDGVRIAYEDQIPLDEFVLFDLGADSLLEPVTDGSGAFRVTQYNPTHMVRTHGPSRHQYLVARAVVDADLVVNLPKLKTHKKAGLTCALKNLIGINGNKEFLPHHRVGGSAAGGDCYPGESYIKRLLEYAFDRLNLASSDPAAAFWRGATRVLDKLARMTGDRLGVEGSWWGNDTIWRTCLDLNRILMYGRSDGTLADEPQRNIVHLVDAVVAGQGEGPLAPDPLPLGMMLASNSAPAMDWVCAQLLGYDPELIPIARQAFSSFRWPLAEFDRRDVSLLGDLGTGHADEVLAPIKAQAEVSYPLGWRKAAASENAVAAPG